MSLLSKITFPKVIKKFTTTFLALKTTGLAAIIFLVFGYPEFFTFIPNFRSRWVGLLSISFYSLVILIIAYFGKWSKKRGLSIWFQSNILVIYALVYFLRFNSSQIFLAGTTIDKNYILIPILSFIFIVNKQLFNQLKKTNLLLVIEVLLITISTYSILDLLKITISDALTFNYQFLLEFFNLPQVFWVCFSAFIISFLSTLNLKVNKYSEVVIFTLLFTTLNVSMFYIINQLNMTYWYKSLLFLCFWDFIYSPFNSIIHRESDTNFISKISISFLYHLILFVVIYISYSNPFIN
jgi:hypothetical protein